jgi:cell wall-active antibiotic response 4TMS protein YvqF/uncharacterized protein DUF1707
MKGDRHPARLAVTEAREQVLERLSDAFARDELGLEEFEARVDGAYQASTEQGLQTLVKDLSATQVVSAPRAELAVLAASSVGAPRALAVLGNVERRGRFSLPNGFRATSVLGNIELDLRDVVLPPGVTQIHVRAVLGNIEIIVPPQLSVQCEGSGILASFAALNRLPAEGSEDGPVLRVVGSAVLGNVEIRTLPRGLTSAGATPKALPPKGGTP